MFTAQTIHQTDRSAVSPSLARIAGVLLIVEALLIFVPIIILGNAINWPASLSEPAEVMLPLLHDQLAASRLGYFVYLIYSVLFFPVALLTSRLAGRGENSTLLQIGIGFAAVSTLARSLGIIRWLVPMPVLAAAYVDPSSSEAAQAGIVAAFTALNAYGGAIGEILGVNLFAALWLITVSLTILRNGVLPRWVGGFGLIAATMLFSAGIEMFGIDIGALISVTTSAIQLWFLAAGITLLRRRAA
ncbi:MAG: DUF4386 domain-containing protein [Oscillochloris sp.]|nr:DUF4386 domain-containing protein [Oscillochloris sp.]